MIIILSGTGDGREIARRLSAEGHRVIATTVTDYGAELHGQDGTRVVSGFLDKRSMKNLIENTGAKVIIDATHPYAVEVSRMSREASEEAGVKYIRYRRPKTKIPEMPNIYRCETYEEAAAKAVTFGNNIFLTTGSKTLGIFTKEAAKKGIRVIARVLPDAEIIKKCNDNGLKPEDIIAMKGPFSVGLNKEMFREKGASVVVTKDGGLTGGTESKIKAAFELNLPVILVERPSEEGEFCTGIDEIVRAAAAYL